MTICGRERDYTATVLDESSGGVGILLEEPMLEETGEFRLGADLDTGYQAVPRTATIAFIAKSGSTRYRLGLEWAAAQNA